MAPIDIRKPLKRLLPYILKAHESNMNEAETLQILLKCFEEILGYDMLTEISREMSIKEKYVDVAMKIDGKTIFLVEAKAAGISLRERFVDQAERYAAEGNIRWVLLTNALVWNLYHLTFEEGIDYQKAFSFDLTGGITDKIVELFTLLHKNSVKSGSLEAFWQRKMAMSPQSIAKALFQEGTLLYIRKEVKRLGNILIDEEDLAISIHSMLSDKARELIGPPRIHRKKKVNPLKKKETASTGDEIVMPIIEEVSQEPEIDHL